MSGFKKFSDFVSGIAVFFAVVFMIRKYMSFSAPLKDPDAPSKLKQFFEHMQTSDYSMTVSLILLLCLALLVGRVFKRFPYVCLASYLPSALHIAYMFEKGQFSEQAALFVFAAVLGIVGSLADAAILDSEDGGHRLSISSKLSYLLGSAVCFLTVNATKGTPPEEMLEATTFQQDIFTKARPIDVDVEIITRLGVMLLILFGISLIFYDIYFIDALLSFVPVGYSLYEVYYGRLKLTFCVILTVCAVCTVSSIMTLVLENNLSKKKQARKKEEQANESHRDVSISC